MNTPQLHRLIDVISALLHPKTGCPWDLEQTHKSLLPFLLEESYEFMNAVESADDNEMKDEIGDVLLQVLLHAEIASKESRFDLESVAQNLADKMIRRHPHVFDKNAKADISEADVKTNWQKIKQEENNNNPNKKTVINKDDLSFPSLYSSYKIGKKTRRLNFDWEEVSQVMYKVEEEWQELKEELAPAKPNKERIAEELGDFLFSTAQLARHLDLDPEEVLRAANKKFVNRFQSMEKFINDDGLDINNLEQNELDHYWAQVKKMS
jgi:MazG family protein